ncbi:hypothetical protein DAPPUDRAFT_113740 [Daphnia pulex]|uniref:Uncharacterized protein n=1 Tax=Daphnia pulex TaxID=6669 RepID=E9HFX6_DAPPU|nr:hypothetical protein DAPPUDRAFT_113740 [Daphnia pulex]|eukprot:EFX69355.1 hypothetical protein DAPPUDRAFT_113740 [Daphnia pulex]
MHTDILPDCTDLSSEQQFEKANCDNKEVEIKTHVPILEVESIDAANELAQNVNSSENDTEELLEGGACGDDSLNYRTMKRKRSKAANENETDGNENKIDGKKKKEL